MLRCRVVLQLFQPFSCQWLPSVYKLDRKFQCCTVQTKSICKTIGHPGVTAGVIAQNKSRGIFTRRISHRWHCSGLTQWLPTRRFSLTCTNIITTVLFVEGYLYEKNPISSLEKCVMGAVATIFPAFLGFGHCQKMFFPLNTRSTALLGPLYWLVDWESFL